MQRTGRNEEEAEIPDGSQAGPSGECTSRSGQTEQETPGMRIKDEAAGDAIYSDPIDSEPGGLFPGAPFSWSSPDSSEGLCHSGGAPEPGIYEERASRPGNSRIPGKDHRRYYHSHWRLEYLMDFNPRCHSMICMVCGSSLATLKLSTIKRHIRQRHPYSLNWTPSEKEVIIGSWDAHLCVDAQTLTGTAGEEPGSEDPCMALTPKKKRRRLPPVTKGVWRPMMGPELSQPTFPNTSHLEQYLNESLQQWFRVEFLMDYDCVGNQLHCMMCASVLPSLNLADIKRHILDTHPTSLQLSPTQKSVILEAWSNRGLNQEEEGEDEMDDDDDDDDDDEEEDILNSEMKESQSLLNLDVNPELDKVVPERHIDKFEGIEEKNDKTEKMKPSSRERLILDDENLEPRKTQKPETRMLLEKESVEAQRTKEENQKLQDSKKMEDEKITRQEVKKWKASEIQVPKKEEQVKKILKLVEVEEKLKLVTRKLEAERKAAQKLEEEEKLRKRESQKLEEEEKLKKIRDQKLKNKENIVKIEEEQQEIDQRVEEERQKSESQMLEAKNQKGIEGLQPRRSLEFQNSVEQDKKPDVDTEKTPSVHAHSTPSMSPVMLGIGLPVLKMESPTPILITRVSSSLVLPAKPSSSLSISSPDLLKSWKVIAPKLSPGEISPPKQAPANNDPASWNPKIANTTSDACWPSGVDPMLWEVSLWRGNPANGNQCSSYQLRWRSDYLMDYNGLRGSVVCMYCCSSLTVLKESSIKRHIIQKHPQTGNYTTEERAAVIHDWETKVAEVRQMVAEQCKDGVARKGDVLLDVTKPPEMYSAVEEESSWSGMVPTDGRGSSWEFAFGRVQGKTKDPRRYEHDRWKLEFLMDYTPEKDGLICMVCGATLLNPKISTVKMHIQQKHPDTTYLSDQEKAVVMEEWEQKLAVGKRASTQQDGGDEICFEINEESSTSDASGSNAENCTGRPEVIKPSSSKSSNIVASLPPPCNSARRNYQVRWRTEFMMDYDCRRQGLICMVCGGTLATLKVSTIKRHIVQVHPYSVDFTPEERQRILEAYSEMALHYIHSEECFKQPPIEETKARKKKGEKA
ncbi:zinc finger translocation-associated protein isoform X1 [Pelobates fuscus]|uniref:zinc finger translocation-associated protein isoform X1 n=1 Tax=Pelobates fuscus TaxID=191477 RepID=UPI002FE4A21E